MKNTTMVLLIAVLLLSGCKAMNVNSSGRGPGSAELPTNESTDTKTFYQNLSKPDVMLALRPDPFVMRGFPDAKQQEETVNIYLPIYPGAIVVGPVKEIGDMGIPMTPYLVDGTLYYQSKDTELEIESWYASAFEKLGYQTFGSGRSGNGKVSSDFVSYSKKAAPSIDLGFLIQGNVTLFKMRATYIITPKRPRETYIPADVAKVQLTQGGRTKTVTDPNWISSVVHQMNALQVRTQGMMHCPSIPLDVKPIQVKFFVTNGSVISATFTLPCDVRDVMVGNSKLPLRSETTLDQAVESPFRNVP